MFCRALAMRSAVAVPDSQWYLLRLANMSTLLREWIALHLMSTLVCVDALLGKPVRAICHNTLTTEHVQAYAADSLVGRRHSAILHWLSFSGSTFWFRCMSSASAQQPQ